MYLLYYFHEDYNYYEDEDEKKCQYFCTRCEPDEVVKKLHFCCPPDDYIEKNFYNYCKCEYCSYHWEEISLFKKYGIGEKSLCELCTELREDYLEEKYFNLWLQITEKPGSKIFQRKMEESMIGINFSGEK